MLMIPHYVTANDKIILDLENGEEIGEAR